MSLNFLRILPLRTTPSLLRCYSSAIISSSEHLFLKTTICNSPPKKLNLKKLLKKSLLINSQFRQLSSSSSVYSNEETREEDQKQSLLVYNGFLSGRIKSLKFLSYSTSMFGSFFLYKTMEVKGVISWPLLIAGIGSMSVFIFMTPLFIHLLSKRYVTQLIYNEKNDSYTAVLYNFFLRRREVNFKVADVIIPEIPGPFTTFFVISGNKGQPLFLNPSDFIHLEHYGKLMGYDKPMDFELNLTSPEVNEDEEIKILNNKIKKKQSVG